MNIQNLMSKPAVTCRSQDMLNTAAQLMWEHDCGSIPVVGDDGTLAGMITDRDICMAAYTRGQPLQAIPVSSAMAKRAFSCQGDSALDAVEGMMRDKQLRRLPVVDRNNRPIGVVSLNDIARYAASSRKSEFEHDLTQTLAAISQPRPHGGRISSARAQ